MGDSAPTAGRVEVWHGIAHADPGPACRSWLDPGELDRLERLATGTLRRRFLCAHAALRQVLSGYLLCHPAHIVIARDGAGRPWLPSAPHIDFSLSHAGDGWAVAVGRDLRLGLDLECLRRPLDHQAVAARSFSPAERALYRLEPPQRRGVAFHRLWTRKEALLKAAGCGLVDALQDIDASSDAAATLSLKRLARRDEFAAAAPLRCASVLDLDLMHGFAAALAVLGAAPEIHFRVLPRPE